LFAVIAVYFQYGNRNLRTLRHGLWEIPVSTETVRVRPAEERQANKTAYDRAYYLANQERLRAYAREYSPRWNKANPDKRHAIDLRYRRAVRSKAIQAYGGVCACCGLDDEPFLSIDHINNDGAEHRRQERLSGAGYHVYKWLSAITATWRSNIMGHVRIKRGPPPEVVSSRMPFPSGSSQREVA
jgi:hypothetical protein